MSRWNLSWLFGITAVTLVGLSISYSAPDTKRAATLKSKHENLRLVVDVLEEVQEKYVKELDADQMRKLVEDMVNGGLEKLDQHSNFIDAEEYKQFKNQSRGKFGGVGIRIGVDRAGQIFVESPMVGTPAYKAGVLAGDIIMKVDGHSIEDKALKDVVEMIQGEPGSKVTLTVLHEGDKKPSDLSMQRSEITIDSVLGDKRNSNKLEEWDFWVDPQMKIAYIRLVAFTETTTRDLVKVVEALQKMKMNGLVIDLRNNPGGLLRSAVEVSSLFLPQGKTVVSTKSRTQGEDDYTSRRVGDVQSEGYPIAILINRYSASASEIVAAALQDHFRAIIVGERSYGKGSVQNIIDLEHGQSALKLTTASYWRPSGHNIHRFRDAKEEDEWGVKPSKGYEVELTDEERINYYKWRRDRDVVRLGAAPKKDKEGDKLEDFKDRVLEKALEYIRGELKKEARSAAAPSSRQPAFSLNAGNSIATPEQRVAITAQGAVGR